MNNCTNFTNSSIHLFSPHSITFTSNFQNINVKFRHKASSTEDLKTLFQAEKELVNHLNATKNKFKENSALRKAVDDYLHVVDYDL